MFLAMAVPVLAACLAALGFRGREALLGLDLGTTYSSIAVRRPGGIVVAEGAQGRLGTPSVVAVSAAGTWAVGEAAERVIAAHPARGVVDAKRVIGRPLGDPMCASEGARHGGRLVQHPTARRVRATGKAVRTAKQRAHCATAADACWLDVAFALELPPELGALGAAQLAAHACIDPDSLQQQPGSGARLLLTPQAAACLVVQDLMAAADRSLGYSVRKAMAATPTDFDAAQRSATLEALERAGLAVSRLLHEPTAAAIAYGLHKDPSVHTVLVYDFGGGTLDVSILFSAHGSFTVIGSAGDNALGGEDVDDCVAARLLADGGGAGAAGAACDTVALSAEAERVKKALCGNGGEGAAGEAAWACGSASGVLTAAGLEEACGALFDRGTAPVREALQGAGLRISEVDEVVLVGGSTRMPAVRARLSALFEGKALRTSVDPDLAVAIGAAASGD